MTRMLPALAVAALAFTTAQAPAQEKYTLKFKEAAEGESYTFTKLSTGKRVTKVIDDKGNALKDSTEAKTDDFQHTTTVLKKAAGDAQPMALRRTYTRAEEAVDGKALPLDLAGKTILIEKKGDMYTFRYEGGGEVTGRGATELEAEFNQVSRSADKDLLPRKAVAVGETWTIDVEVFKKGLKPDVAVIFDFDKLKATGKLVKAYKKDGAQFAVLEIAIELHLRENVEPSKGYKVLGGKAVVKVTMDACVDGSSFARNAKLATETEIRSANDVNGMRSTMTVQASASGTEAYEDAKKK